MRKIISVVAAGATTLALSGGALSHGALHKDATLSVDRANTKVTSRSSTVADVLKEQLIPVSKHDVVAPATSAKVADGTHPKVDTRTVTEKQKVSYDTVWHRTSQLRQGVRRVSTTGRAGIRTLTYREVRRNGLVVARQQVDSTVTTKARSRVVLVGTKVVVHPTPVVHKSVRKPAVQHSASSQSSSSRSANRSSARSPRVASGGVWDKIARCEAGGNWSISTGNGFYGGLQFTLSTWRAFGGSGMPNHASRGQQIAVAKRIQASQGWGAWPACTSRLGLR